MPTWPAEILAFCEAHKIDLSVYERALRHHAVPRRYFRLNPLADPPADLATIKAELAASTVQIDDGTHQEPSRVGAWCKVADFYSLPGNVALATLPSYKRGAIHAMDVASAVAVQALSVQPDDHVLDLCCAPGNKMAIIATLLRRTHEGRPGRGTVTGVDIAKHRLYTTKSAVLKKLACLGQCRLFLADGTTFSEPPVAPHPAAWTSKEDRQTDGKEASPTRTSKEDRQTDGKEATATRKRKRQEALRPLYQPRLLAAGVPVDSGLYDKVLVDAECTHDGSIVHMLKHLTSEADTKEQQARKERDLAKFFEASLSKADDRPVLQKALLTNGFRLLKTGGLLVYATCSFTREQNEDVVHAFLGEQSDAVLLPVPDKAGLPLSSFSPVTAPDERMKEILAKTVRLGGASEDEDWTSGLFIALLQKTVM